MSSARAVKLQSVPPPRSPAREKLAQVIARNKEAAHAIGKLETALREASQRRWQARSALERAQEAAREAREAQARHVIDSALGEAGSEPLSPEAAQAAIECAEEQFENAGGPWRRLSVKSNRTGNETVSGTGSFPLQSNG